MKPRPTVRIQFTSDVIRVLGFPRAATSGAAGFDLYADIEQAEILLPRDRLLVRTGIRMAIPSGWEGQIRPRSGLALKQGLTVLNAPATIDSDYRGEVRVLLVNASNDVATITPYERIAQLVFARVASPVFEIGELDETERGESGFGSTGTHDVRK